MSGIKSPKFLENNIPTGYYEDVNPYKDAPRGNINLLELSRYARKVGKKLYDLNKTEVQMFQSV